MNRPARSQPPAQQEAHIRREKKGRGGKTVTVVYNLRLSPDRLKELGKHLRQACGTGGTVKDGTIEIQGDHRDRVAEALQAAGYRTKFTGG
ncbi:MAG TPA: translation initiation factor [Anaerolineae bacterium]|nr:translation initiation factor [Anaerolineae bacterium]